MSYWEGRDYLATVLRNPPEALQTMYVRKALTMIHEVGAKRALIIERAAAVIGSDRLCDLTELPRRRLSKVLHDHTEYALPREHSRYYAERHVRRQESDNGA